MILMVQLLVENLYIQLKTNNLITFRAELIIKMISEGFHSRIMTHSAGWKLLKTPVIADM